MSSGRNRFRLKGLGLRLGLLYALIFLLSSGWLMYMVYEHMRDSGRVKDQEFVQATLHRYSQIDQDEGRDALILRLAQDRAYNALTGLLVVVADRQGALQDLTVPVGWRPDELNGLKTGLRDAWSVIAKDGFKRHRSARPIRDEIVYTAQGLADGSSLIIGFSEGRRSDYLEDLLEIFNAYIIWALLLGIAGGLLFSRRALAPLRDLTRTVAAVIAGDVGARVKLRSGGTELNELTAQFNVMLARIDQLIGAMRATLDNVAHDLRTPLSRMRISLERAGLSDDAALLKDALLDCAEETEKIQALVTALMNIAEAESGLLQLEPAEIDLESFLRDLLELFEYACEERQVSLTLRVAPGLTVWADPVKLRQMLMNLVDNAIKYGRPAGQVAISAARCAGGVAIEVCDDGSGIAPEQIDLIFERLYRGDSSRSARGLGLGLALVRAYAQAHGGSVRVSSSAGHGSTFTIFLPIFPLS